MIDRECVPLIRDGGWVGVFVSASSIIKSNIIKRKGNLLQYREGYERERLPLGENRITERRRDRQGRDIAAGRISVSERASLREKEWRQTDSEREAATAVKHKSLIFATRTSGVQHFYWFGWRGRNFSKSFSHTIFQTITTTSSVTTRWRGTTIATATAATALLPRVADTSCAPSLNRTSTTSTTRANVRRQDELELARQTRQQRLNGQRHNCRDSPESHQKGEKLKSIAWFKLTDHTWSSLVVGDGGWIGKSKKLLCLH